MRALNKKYWPQNVAILPTRVIDAQRWCYETFKSRDWRDVGVRFYFKRPQDASLFALKWA